MFITKQMKLIESEKLNLMKQLICFRSIQESSKKGRADVLAVVVVCTLPLLKLKTRASTAAPNDNLFNQHSFSSKASTSS